MSKNYSKHVSLDFLRVFKYIVNTNKGKGSIGVCKGLFPDFVAALYSQGQC